MLKYFLDDNSSHEAIKNKGVISINSVRNSHLRWGAKRCICVWVGMFFTSIYCHFSAIGAAGFSLGLNFWIIACRSFFLLDDSRRRAI